jgi:hypothetical protein
MDRDAMEGADAIIHLAGASIADGRWTEARKNVLCSSRVDSTRILVDAVAALRRRPRAFLAASATGYYGNRGDELLTESSANGSGFLAEVGRDWEAEASRAEALGVRTVLLRFGMILSARGGALPRIVTPFKLGLGGRLGGEQWMSWIALEDVLGVIRAALADERFSGPVNVATPNPVRNIEFTCTLARVLRRPAIFAAPVFALRLALGHEMADELLLASQRVQPEKLLALAYAFRLSELEHAVRSILAEPHA